MVAMSNSLLKQSSGWYMRPRHRKRAMDSIPPIESNIPSNASSISPEEEFYIRKCCPVTLNHLLPDLYLTQRHHVAELGEEFDMNLRTKFEKHLEESHKDVSCTSSTTNDEDYEDTRNLQFYEDNRNSTGYEENIDDCIENDINTHILQSNNLENSSKKLLRPHKINYPDSEMSEWKLPDIALNNNYPEIFHDNTFPSNLISSKNVPKDYSKRTKSQHLHDVKRIVFPSMKKDQVEFLDDRGDSPYTDSRNNRVEEHLPVKRENTGENVLTRVPPRITIDSSYSSSRLPRDISSYSSTYSCPNPPSYQNRASLCIQHRRSRSLSPIKKLPLTHMRSAARDDYPSSLILPSPHLVQLARLKKQELELEEKILLRHRQKLELERLKPPLDRWYEIKDFRFHQEAHKNNVYLRNERILPYIQERRKELYEALRNPSNY